MKELMSKFGIKQSHSSPYYPQCNGLVEKVNGMICKIITKHVGEKMKTWDKHLNVALWAYRTLKEYLVRKVCISQSLNDFFSLSHTHTKIKLKLSMK